MNPRKAPPILNRRLGRRLKALREQAGLSLQEAAAKLDKTRSSLNRIETGFTRADIHLVRSMLDVYDRYEEDLFNLVRAAWKPRWFRTFSNHNVGYVDAETEAVTVREFSALVVPGLLQTEAYAREILGNSLVPRTTAELDNQVAMRLIRQQRLTSDGNSLELVTIVDEVALRREVGGPEVMRDQLHRIAELAALRSVTVHVLPLAAGPHGAMDGSFILLEFLDDPELLYVPYVAGALHIEEEVEVRAARLIFDQLREEALDPSESATVIERLAGR